MWWPGTSVLYVSVSYNHRKMLRNKPLKTQWLQRAVIYSPRSGDQLRVGWCRLGSAGSGLTYV